MERGLILLVAALVVCVAPDVQGTSHLSFSSNTEVNITRYGCGVSKLCVETPDDCDPAGNTSCLFMSANTSMPMPPNGTDLYVELRGYSMGYVALGLTMNASEGYTMLFICAQNSSNNGSFFFRTMQKNNTNNELSATERRVKEIRGMVKEDVIKCEFVIPYLNATSMTKSSSADTTYAVVLGTGPVVGGSIGAFNASLTTAPLNLANPASNVPTTMAPPVTNTTMMANTTTANSSGAVQPHAVLLLLSVLSLSVMLRV